jgi:SAM-dependent methyltransferase
MPAATNYSQRFQGTGAGSSYDSGEYGAGSHSAFLWELQRPVLAETVRQLRAEARRPLSLLDFACGTGRVLSCLEPLVESSEGIDISPQMLEVARTRCARSRLQAGDILTQPEVLGKNYDVITLFRFLLNVEPEVRGPILRRLREVIREPDGLLVANVHGNSRSLRHPAIVWRRWHAHSQPGGMMLNELSPGAARALLRDCGFRVVRQFGFGILPAAFHRSSLRGLAAVLDRSLAGDNWSRNWSVDLLFICRPA